MILTRDPLLRTRVSHIVIRPDKLGSIQSCGKSVNNHIRPNPILKSRLHAESQNGRLLASYDLFWEPPCRHTRRLQTHVRSGLCL